MLCILAVLSSLDSMVFSRRHVAMSVCLGLLSALLLLNSWLLSYSGSSRTQSMQYYNCSWLQQLRGNSSRLLGGDGHASVVTCRGPSPAAVLDLRLFVGVLSTSHNLKARDTIRAAWGSDSRIFRLIFFLQRPNNDTIFKIIRDEAAHYGDIVITSEIYEDYYNITYSVLDLFKVAAHMSGDVTHVLKTDDDVYIRLDLLLPVLQAMPRQWLYAGTVDHGSVIRTPGWHFVPYDNWASDKPVRYAFGWGYVTSIDIAKEIALGAVHMIMPPSNLLIIEDVAVGYWIDYIAKERNTSIHHESLRVATSCAVDVAILHITEKPQWQVMKCMHEHGGRCCDTA